MTIDQQQFIWKRQPQAEKLLESFLTEGCNRNLFLKELEHALHHKASSRLFDWVDHYIVKDTPRIEGDLKAAGFLPTDETHSGYRVFHHPGAQLPRVIARPFGKDNSLGVAIKVESIADFLMVRGITRDIEGDPCSGYRRCLISNEGAYEVYVAERRGTWTFEPTSNSPGYLERYHLCKEKWATRPRHDENEERMMIDTHALADEIISLVGVNLGAWIVFEVEREFWQRKNRAAQIQKNRQDHLGMGWANHDHHTFRSGRAHFHQMVNLWKKFGFHCRERFYAGEEAGWGAQVVENPVCGLTCFLDVDLSPEEISIDFANQPLAERDHLGTIGLWCALHGDSIFQAGMHHLEAQFEFDQLTQDLAKHGIGMMAPFSNFEYLKQAFTHGEIWPVSPKRVQKLVERKSISPEQGKKFLAEGALGSHLENLQRHEGFKGFNQKNVSFIIRKTDPREASANAGA